MALEFRKRRFRRPDQRGQLAIALAAVLLGLCVVAAWIAVSFRSQTDPDDAAVDSSASDTARFEAMSPVNLLVILTDEGYERFTLIQIDPAAQQVRAAAVPPTLAVGDADTLAATMQKNGIANAVKCVTDVLQLPIKHYIALSAEQAESWFNYLESGVVVTLQEAVNYTDPVGTVVRLDKGEHNLTATQTVALMRYTGWQDADAKQHFTAQVLTAMINQHASVGRRFSSDFATLANLGKTSLRIGDFDNFLPALNHTVSTDDTLCVTEFLKGDYVSNRFVFDQKKTHAATSLY